MKLFNLKNVPLLVLALVIGYSMQTALAQVYKVVDKDGNVTYTDTAPKDGSAPVDLPPISVIETPEYQVKPKADSAQGNSKKSMRALRSDYRDFAITSPTSDDSVWAPEQSINVAWSTRKPLLQGMLVEVAIDGTTQAQTVSNSVAVPPLDRGEHTVEATLLDGDGKVISRAQPVTFFVRQPNLYSNPPIPVAKPKN